VRGGGGATHSHARVLQATTWVSTQTPHAVSLGRLATSFLLVGLGLLVTACDWTDRFNLAEPVRVEIKTPTLTLIWDRPLNDVPHAPSRVASYRVYVREYDGWFWTLLDEIPASEQPRYEVEHDRVGSGAFIFAIQAVSATGGASPLHSSLDLTADPIGGWYVHWFH